MSLQSRIFQGDARLKAAAVSDPAHITPGAVGDHVVKIQIALMLLDGTWVADHEMRAGIYGRTTAAAVLAYKTKRGIINRSYQSQADDIVGKMTIAAMDRELVARNLRPATIACDYGPQRVGPSRPLFTLTSFHPAPAPPVQPPSPIVYVEVAKNTAPEAIDWIRATIRALDEVIARGATAPNNAALLLHFKCVQSDAADTARIVKASYEKMIDVLSQARTIFTAGIPGQGAFAYNLTPRDGRIYILVEYLQLGKRGKPTILIHESFHFLDQFNQDFGGNPARDRGARYHKNDKAAQLRNAYAFSQFALHIHEGQETFNGDTD